MKEREPRKETVGRGELFFLGHPGTEDIFSGYGLTMQQGSKEFLVGLMVDRPYPVYPDWLSQVEDTFGEYELVPMTPTGERGIFCQIQIETADWRQRIAELAGNAEERVAILRERGELKEKIRRLTILYRDLVIYDESYREQREQYQRRVASLVLRENPKLIDAGKYLERLGEVWEAYPEERRNLTRIMVKAI